MVEILVTAVVMCNNLNLTSYPCNAPVGSFELVEGGFEGYLESGIPFSQKSILTNQSEKIMKFEIQNAWWYICKGKDIWAEDDLTALSICLV